MRHWKLSADPFKWSISPSNLSGVDASDALSWPSSNWQHSGSLFCLLPASQGRWTVNQSDQLSKSLFVLSLQSWVQVCLKVSFNWSLNFTWSYRRFLRSYEAATNSELHPFQLLWKPLHYWTLPKKQGFFKEENGCWVLWSFSLPSFDSIHVSVTFARAGERLPNCSD